MPTDQGVFDPTYPVRRTSLGKHLQKKRIDLGLSLADVARRLGAKEATAWRA